MRAFDWSFIIEQIASSMFAAMVMGVAVSLLVPRFLYWLFHGRHGELRPPRGGGGCKETEGRVIYVDVPDVPSDEKIVSRSYVGVDSFTVFDGPASRQMGGV